MKDEEEYKDDYDYIPHEEYYGESRCPSCYGRMTYCETCRMWSSYCCEEFGTCACS